VYQDISRFFAVLLLIVGLVVIGYVFPVEDTELPG
jgi:hypothetical protein